MRRWVVVIVLGLLIAGVTYVVFTSGTPFKTIAIWLVGLGGLVYSGLERLLNFLGPGRELDRAEARNEEIRQEVARLQREMAESERRLEEERALRRREIERVETEIAGKRQTHQATVDAIADLEAMTYEEYYRSLPIEERRRIDAEMMDGVIDGSSLR